MSTITKDLGAVTAYAYAVEQGYTGTEEEFAELMADYAAVEQRAAQSATAAQTSASNASLAASASAQSASQASTSATAAGQSASTASTKADEASTSAQTAGAKAAEAAESARTLTIDPTLTQSGQAADAKVVGDGIGELKSALSDKFANIATTWVGANILSPSLIIDGYFISNGDGTLTANANYFVSDFVEVTGGATYTFCTWLKGSVHPQSTRYIVLFYNSDKTPISESYINTASGGRSITITAPESAKYIRVSSIIYDEQYECAYMLEQADAITTYAEYETLTVINDASNILYGKKWVACGDSFTHGDFSGSSDNTLDIGRYKGQNKVYPFFIGNRNNMDVVNEAVNGSTMCLNDGTHNAFSTANGRYTQIPSDADYITLYFGINDGNYSSPIGTIDDADNTTFYGAWNVVLDYLMRNHPYAKIGIIVTNGTSMAYINAEKAIAAKWGIPYLDMNDIQTPVMNRSNNQSISETVRSFRTQMFSVNAPTNTHPSSKAHEYESTFIEAFLRRL